MALLDYGLPNFHGLSFKVDKNAQHLHKHDKPVYLHKIPPYTGKDFIFAIQLLIKQEFNPNPKALRISYQDDFRGGA